MENIERPAAIFLDRDGVIIHNRSGYIRTWEQVNIYPYTISALIRLAATPYKIAIITNQSAIGRGLVSVETVVGINNKLAQIICSAGGRIDGIFICPHAPKEACSCRKPKPGLIFQAAEKMGLDLSRSILIGDAISDILAAKNAGIGRSILVLTGRGKKQHHLAADLDGLEYQVYPSIAQAAFQVAKS